MVQKAVIVLALWAVPVVGRACEDRAEPDLACRVDLAVGLEPAEVLAAAGANGAVTSARWRGGIEREEGY